MNTRVNIIGLDKASDQPQHKHLWNVVFKEEGQEVTGRALIKLSVDANTAPTEAMKTFVSKLFESKISKEDTPEQLAEKVLTLNLEAGDDGTMFVAALDRSASLEDLDFGA